MQRSDCSFRLQPSTVAAVSNSVVVRAADGTARTRAVTIGGQLPDGRVEVLSGIDAGEQVVIDAPGPVADGTPLEIGR